MSLRGTQTEKNILAAFAGESQARNRYTYAAKQADKEGYKQIAAIFEETADQEREHAKRLFKMLQGGEVEITASFPAGVIVITATNLLEAANGEHHECTSMYPDFAAIARNDGFPEIARVFEAIAVAERQHEKRFRALLANLDNDRVFRRSQPRIWCCRNCGWLHEGTEAPEQCDACAHPRAHFEILGENY
jgi:rubrerythrin